jgi:hypothetical protein
MFILFFGGPVWVDSHIGRQSGVTVVNLTQTPCHFVEAEVDPQNYHSTKKADCVAINKQTVDKWKFKPCRLRAGKVTFRVSNKNVPYELGFWVRGRGLGRVTLPTVSGVD